MSTHICHPHSFYDLCAANMPWSFHTHSFLWFMCCNHAMITLFECFTVWYHDHSILVRIIFSNLCAANMSWLLACLFIRFDIKNVIKIHFAMKTLKRVKTVMWTLETKLVQPKSNSSPWLLGHHGMSPLHGGVAGTCFRVRDSTRSNSHRIMV